MGTPMEDAQMEQQGVRFSSHNDEIEPEPSLEHVTTITRPGGTDREDLNPEAEQELQQLKTTLRNNMQSARMQHHAFEPVSLPGSQPASRVPSGSSTPSRRHLAAGSHDPSPRASPPPSAFHSPPLTPAATKSTDGKVAPASSTTRHGPQIMTPQRSASPHDDTKPTQPVDGVSSHPKPSAKLSAGPGGDSEPVSKDASQVPTPSSTAPCSPRPFTPSSQVGDAKAKRQSQVSSGDDQYRFGSRDPAVGFSTSGMAPPALPSAPGLPSAPTLPRSNATGSTIQAFDNKRSSFFGGSKKDHHDDGSGKLSEKDSHSSSKSNLKRFFKFGEHKHHHHHSHGSSKEKSHESAKSSSGTSTPPTSDQAPSVPFADDHGLQSKYGKFGKMLGSGAGGSVRLMKRTGDGTVFAVKQFRDRHAYESEKEYNKKVTAEFCIGSTLHHGNIIETIDIVHEKGKWYEVMEYAPFDLFATVMTGKMSREEVACSTLQILSGVLYLHSMGLAHRDLKLDNVVINDHGIMKLIDFGSAVVFRYPFEKDVVLATGVVGSDPYLAPEVYDQTRYDPRPADIWSIAIIFCCMTLRRFPWKAPRLSDNSYRLFVSTPDPDQDKILESHRRSVAPGSNRTSVVGPPAAENASSSVANGSGAHQNHQNHRDDESKTKSEPVSRQPTQDPSSTGQQATIKGPVRLLRLLPRETRHIIGRMLELDPKKRANMDEILADPWVQNSLVCRQEEDGVIINCPNHTHALQPSNSGK